jgi:hypothetical protein
VEDEESEGMRLGNRKLSLLMRAVNTWGSQDAARRDALQEPSPPAVKKFQATTNPSHTQSDAATLVSGGR